MRQSYLDKMSAAQVKKAYMHDLADTKMNLKARLNHYEKAIDMITWYDDFPRELGKDAVYQKIKKEFEENSSLAKQAAEKKDIKTEIACDKNRWEILKRLNIRHEEIRKGYEQNIGQKAPRINKVVSPRKSAKGALSLQ